MAAVKKNLPIFLFKDGSPVTADSDTSLGEGVDIRDYTDALDQMMMMTYAVEYDGDFIAKAKNAGHLPN